MFIKKLRKNGFVRNYPLIAKRERISRGAGIADTTTAG